MSEWHVTPDYIVNNWTDELLDLMIEKLVERRKRETPQTGTSERPEQATVPIETLAARSRGMIKMKKV